MSFPSLLPAMPPYLSAANLLPQRGECDKYPERLHKGITLLCGTLKVTDAILQVIDLIQTTRQEVQSLACNPQKIMAFPT
jgi:hypothetical protein